MRLLSRRRKCAEPPKTAQPNFNPKVGWWENAEWLAKYDRFVRPDDFTGEHHHRILDRRFTLQSLTASVRNLRGSTAECGVFKGIGSALICATLNGTYDKAFHYGFDSFEGLPDPGPGDANWQKGQLTTPVEATRKHLAEFQFCRLVVGWIPHTFRDVDAQFRLVHIDVDLEEPTRQSLDFFYPRAVKGALFIFDDYGFRSCPGTRKAINEFLADKPETIVELATGQAFFYRSSESDKTGR